MPGTVKEPAGRYHSFGAAGVSLKPADRRVDVLTRFMRIAKVLFFALVGLVAGGFLFTSGYREFSETRQLQRNGATIEAKVLDERTRYRGKGRTRYFLTVEFQTPERAQVTQEAEVDYDTHAQGAAQGHVLVHYLPADPTILRAGQTVATEFGNMLLGVFIVGCGGVSLLFIRQPSNRKELAEDTAKHLESLCDAEQRYVTVDGKSFTGVDQTFYDTAQREFESHGFVFLEDMEVIASKPTKGLTRTFVRLLLSPDRTRVANIFHVKPGVLLKTLGAKDARVIGVDTQMSDNSFVCTDTAESCNALNSPPDINSSHLPAASNVETVLTAHAHRVETQAVFRAGAAPVKMYNSEDVRRSMELQTRIKAEYRQQVGLSKEELERLAGSKNNPVVDDLHADLERQRDQSRRDAA